MSTQSQQLPPGTKLDKYTIVRTLGINYQCITYLATDDESGESVVLRESMPSYCDRDSEASLSVVISPEYSSLVQEQQKAFLDAASAWMKMEHPHIAKVTHCFVAFGTVYYACQYIEGDSLKNYWERYGALEAEVSQTIATGLLDALSLVHEQGQLHKDIRPSNILMQGRDKPLFIDFCPPYERSNEDYHSEDYQYTPYCAPEQIWMWSAGNCGPWTDIYALGAVLYSLIAGAPPRSPFERLFGRPFALNAPKVYEPLAVQKGLREQYPVRLLASIDKALSLRVENRWQSARQWMECLQAEPSTRILPPGFEVGEYTIERELGQGGFGVTYVAMNRLLSQRVVIKELLPQHSAWRDLSRSAVVKARAGSAGEEAFARAQQNFLHEARTLAKLNHPNIIRILTAFAANDTFYYAVPYHEGTSLDAYCHSHEAPRESWLRCILEQLLEALEYLARRDILHLDIKPANILLTARNCPVLIDFGNACNTDDVASRKHVFTRGYSPAELLTPDGKVGPWSDVYALGASFYSLLTGKTPPDSAQLASGYAVLEPLAECPELLERYSEDFLRGIDKAMAPVWEERWQHPWDWLNDLKRENLSGNDSGCVVVEPPAANAAAPGSRPLITQIITCEGGISQWGISQEAQD